MLTDRTAGTVAVPHANMLNCTRAQAVRTLRNHVGVVRSFEPPRQHLLDAVPARSLCSHPSIARLLFHAASADKRRGQLQLCCCQHELQLHLLVLHPQLHLITLVQAHHPGLLRPISDPTSSVNPAPPRPPCV